MSVTEPQEEVDMSISLQKLLAKMEAILDGEATPLVAWGLQLKVNVKESLLLDMSPTPGDDDDE